MSYAVHNLYSMQGTFYAANWLILTNKAPPVRQTFLGLYMYHGLFPVQISAVWVFTCFVVPFNTVIIQVCICFVVLLSFSDIGGADRTFARKSQECLWYIGIFFLFKSVLPEISVNRVRKCVAYVLGAIQSFAYLHTLARKSQECLWYIGIFFYSNLSSMRSV